MNYLGDILEDQVLYFWWSSNGADGASITRATNGTISVYKNADNTQSTAGVTDSEDTDSVTGCHRITIDTSADAFYETGKDYAVVLSGATIDGKTVNAVLGHFSIENRNTKANVVQLGGVAQSLTDLKDFADDGYDPSTNKVQGVVLTDTTTTLTNAPSDSTGVTTLLARLTNTRAGYLDNLNGHVAQTGDSYAIVNSVTHGNAALKTLIDAVQTTTNSIETDTQDLQVQVGVAGAGLTDVPRTGYKLASDGLNLVVPADPNTTKPVLGTASIVAWIGYFGAWTVNEVNSDSDSVDLRNTADNANLASHATSDDGSTFISGAAS